MPTRNALGSVRLTYTQRKRNGPYHVLLQVWSRSYDHPDPGHRSAFIRGVSLANLPAGAYVLQNVHITDRGGIDSASMWGGINLPTEVGFDGYREVDTGRPCQPGFPNVLWGVYTGIYDERCLADPACDARRLQMYANWPQLVGFNYLISPVTFAFDVAIAAPPTAVRLRMSLIGGNDGNPAQRFSTLPDEVFTIQF